MPLLKKKDPTRRWRSFKRHAMFLLRAGLAAVAITALWWFCRSRGWCISEEDKEVLLGGFIPTLGVIYGVYIAFLINAAYEKYKEIVVAVLTKDKRTFMLWRDERMLIAMHLQIAIISVPFVGMIGAIGYHSAITGAFMVSCVSLIVVAFWMIVSMIENPTTSEWFTERIPHDWLTEDVDTFFELEKNGK
jgi:hypothetical protein